MKITESKHFDKFIDALFVLIAIFVAIYAREAFMDFTAGIRYYFYGSERILTTNDGYHYASAVKDLINGHISDAFYPVAIKEMPVILTFLIYKILPFSLDSICFVMPIVLSSLLSIPVYFFAKSIMNRYFALFSAMLAPLIWAYVNRTSAGAYDTDMLILVLPMCALYFLYKLLNRFCLKDLIFCAIFCALALEWHKVSATYVLSLSVFMTIIYALFKKDARLLGGMGVLLISLAHFDIFVKLIAIAILLHFISQKPRFFRNITEALEARLKYKNAIIFLIGFAAFFISNADIITSRFTTYISKEMLIAGSMTFKTTAGTIVELFPLDIFEMPRDMFGDQIAFFVAVLGVLLMFFKNKKTLILLPIILMGFSSLKLGARFSMFSAPVLSLGYFYFIFFVLGFLGKIFKTKNFLILTQALALCVFAYYSIAPNYYHAKTILISPVLKGEEASGLLAIKEDSKSRADLTFAWWDHGFTIPYFSNTRSIISGADLDGVKHFVASLVLTNHDNLAAYNAAKLIFESLDVSESSELFKMNNVDRILHKYGGTNSAEEFFTKTIASTEFVAPEIESNIYIYLPFSILDYQTAISEFSDINYETGEVIHKDKTHARYKFSKKSEDDERARARKEEEARKNAPKKENGEIDSNSLDSNVAQNTESSDLHSGAQKAQDKEREKVDELEEVYNVGGEFTFDAKTGILKNIEGKTLQAQSFRILERDENGEIKKRELIYNSDPKNLHMVYSKELEMIIAIDDWTHKSLLVQFFLYENYDKNLFTLIHADKGAKVYKLKGKR